jgi:hypothetical protein
MAAPTNINLLFIATSLLNFDVLTNSTDDSLLPESLPTELELDCAYQGE